MIDGAAIEALTHIKDWRTCPAPFGVTVYVKGDDFMGDWFSIGTFEKKKHGHKFRDYNGDILSGKDSPSWWTPLVPTGDSQ